MAWKKLEKKETPMFWWVWKDRVGQALEGYWVGVFDHEDKAKVLVVYDKDKDLYYRAFVPKRYDLSELKSGWKVRITALQDKETQKLDWEIEYDEKNTQLVVVPDEYYDVEI